MKQKKKKRGAQQQKATWYKKNGDIRIYAVTKITGRINKKLIWLQGQDVELGVREQE